VLDGSIPANKLIRQAVERHQRDLETAHERGLWFDAAAGERAIEFCRFLRHSKGEWAGQEFKPEPWQMFILWCLFGWKRADGLRRFRTAYIEVPRKNGKSTLIAAIGLMLFFADGEPGAEVYTAATKRDQARIVHGEAVRMVKSSPSLRSRIRAYKDNLHVESTFSKFEPLGADSDTMDGLNIHGALVDELHAHKDRGTWDVIETATGSRRQPMVIAITTAGHDLYTVCGELHEYCVKILEQVLADDTTFAFVACLDEGDDPWVEATHRKANPNYGISVKPDDLQRKVIKAQSIASARNAFLRLHLNKWTEADVAAIPIEKWDACNARFDPARLAGTSCFAGLDLSRTRDLTAFVQVFAPDEASPLWRIVPHFWIPADRAAEKQREDRVPYVEWAKAGLVKLTPGDETDYLTVRKDIQAIAGVHYLREIAFDPWNATSMAQDLERDGFRMVSFHQSFANFSEPTKMLLTLVDQKGLAHNGHDLLRWNASNLSVKEDANQNIRPVKPKRRTAKRIDGIVALIMGLARATYNPTGGLDVRVI
jgi:phage terminase large subunit-like protein